MKINLKNIAGGIVGLALGVALGIAGNAIAAGLGPTGNVAGLVSSVFGRVGVVVAASGDYAFSQISGSLATTQLAAPAGSGTLVQTTLHATTSIAANSTGTITIPTAQAGEVFITDSCPIGSGGWYVLFDNNAGYIGTPLVYGPATSSGSDCLTSVAATGSNSGTLTITTKSSAGGSSTVDSNIVAHTR